jgi:hypothetical protein
VLVELGAQTLRSSHTQATLTAATRVLGAIMEARDEIHDQLAELAEEAIRKLEAVEAIGDTSLDQLVRTGRHDEARLYADCEIIATELDQLYTLRDLYLTPGGGDAVRVGHFDASRWRNPTKVENHLHGGTLAENYLAGLGAGGALWYPSAEEAVDAAQPLYDAWHADAQRIAAEQHGVGSLAAFG